MIEEGVGFIEERKGGREEKKEQDRGNREEYGGRERERERVKEISELTLL